MPELTLCISNEVGEKETIDSLSDKNTDVNPVETRKTTRRDVRLRGSVGCQAKHG